MESLTFLNQLQDVIEDRLRHPKDSSYTTLLASEGPLKVAQKLGEEAVETAVACAAEDDERLTAEAADLLYHLLVLLSVRELSLSDVVDELERRHG